MQPIIQFKNVGVCYDRGKSNETQALKDISLDIYEGEYIVFFGPSGCGKSTLLYTIAGLETATEGDVTIKGQNLKDMRDRERITFYRNTIGMVFQAFYLVPHLSAKDNMMLSKMFGGVPVQERQARAQVLMDKFGITPYADRKPNMLSGGQQQRTAIGRALMNDPEIILADEPVGNLDSKNAETVLELLAQINKTEKKTVIQVTHNPKDTHYADRVFYMKDGVVERIVVNTATGRAAAGKGGDLSELEKLAQANPDLSGTQLHARYVMRSILMPYDLDTEHKIESAIERYLDKKITRDELARALDDQKMGAGLYTQKARKIAVDVEAIAKEIEEVLIAKHTPHATKMQLETPAMSIRKRLLDSYEGALDREEIHDLDEAIALRIEGRITAAELREFFDAPRAKGGLALRRATAKRFSEYVEMIIAS